MTRHPTKAGGTWPPEVGVGGPSTQSPPWSSPTTASVPETVVPTAGDDAEEEEDEDDSSSGGSSIAALVILLLLLVCLLAVAFLAWRRRVPPGKCVHPLSAADKESLRERLKKSDEELEYYCSQQPLP